MTPQEKEEAINGFANITAHHAVTLFEMLELKTHFKCTVKNSKGETFRITFKKL